MRRDMVRKACWARLLDLITTAARRRDRSDAPVCAHRRAQHVLKGSTPRRCPDISKLAALGYRPRVPLDQGLPPTLKWYWDHENMAPAA
jgi:nucleoside-diphosphate-sugar epimerase